MKTLTLFFIFEFLYGKKPSLLPLICQNHNSVKYTSDNDLNK